MFVSSGFEYGLNCSFVFRKYFRFRLIKRLFSFCTSLNFQENIQRSKEKQAKYHNRNARFLQELNRGDTVRIAPQQGNKAWEKGVVKNKHSERSYV
jgi:hypothetical protein